MLPTPDRLRVIDITVSFRTATRDLKCYIGTTRTARYRTFSFVDKDVISESKVVIIASEDAGHLAVLSSKYHVTWAFAVGGMLGVGNNPTYNHTDCFNTFPFPDLTEDQRIRLRNLGEELDTHLKRRQAAHPKLTLTQMYNVLEMVRAGEAIEGKDREIYKQGLIGTLKDLHDETDAEVARAYGWPVDLKNEDILVRLVALNKARAEEEARGHVCWLRPDYQNPKGNQGAG